MSITERVEELAAVMRRVGAVRAEVNKTGIKLELGQEPNKTPIDIRPKSDEQVLADARVQAKEMDRMLFAASEGYLDEVPDE